MHDPSRSFRFAAASRRSRRSLQLRVGALALAFSVLSGCAEMQAQMEAAGIDLNDILVAGAPLDATTVATGLKQALEVGTQRTTTTLSRPGAFGNDPILRLRLPGELGRVAEVLRGVGFGAQVDQLEDSMNLAAEEAAAQAVPVFTSAITQMSIADAFQILNGPDDAATQYFQARTSDELRSRFQPVAARAMREVGLYEIYTQIVARYDQIPFTKPPALDLEGFVADQTLAALFGEIAKEEAKIRADPAARSTALLRRVFGAVGTPEAQGPGGR
ncbi:MAG: DUF4197 domain-containing protein [Myxococcota bacterium]